MSHRKCCRRDFGCGSGFGGNSFIWLIIIAFLICNCNGGRRFC